jgi:hypothetical protein
MPGGATWIARVLVEEVIELPQSPRFASPRDAQQIAAALTA